MNKKRRKNLLSRRDFLKRSCAAIGSASVMSTLANLAMTKTVMADNHLPFTDYKAVVCVFQHGGNDSFNMLMPYEDGISNPAFTDEYSAYQTARGPIALNRVTNPITDAITGRQFGVHEQMPEVKGLFDANKLAFLANVGSLVQPTTPTQFANMEDLPARLFSHSDLQLHWQTSRPDEPNEPTGWMGRMLSATDSLDASDVGNIFRNIALIRTNTMQTAGDIIPFVVSASGNSGLANYTSTGTGSEESIAYSNIIDSIFRDTTYSNILESTVADIHTRAIDGAVAYNGATENVVVTPFPGDTLGNELKEVAKAISARVALGDPGRQVFFVEIGGWDLHNGLLLKHGPLLSKLSQALGAFSTSMEALGMQDNVTTFTASDFGRTLSSNGTGTDHGWGGNTMVMGGAVDGGKIFGDYPTDLTAPAVNGNSIDIGRGRLVPTTSVDELYADLALWYGVPFDQLSTVLPNLPNFYTPGAAVPPPIGFMKQV